MNYIESLLPESIKSIPTHMDFDGQRRAERYFQVIIVLYAIVGFVWGYATQSFSQTLYILFAGVFLSSVLTLVPWKMYRSQPLQWQPARVEQDSATPSPPAVTGNPGSQSKSKKKKIKE
ncbi:signal peptidase complex subunit 1 [Aplysia californica]|uniref:Signal peptidase complex subunit 1 n=1 Tax=Aplysia californica TaxID=6500 RepID=A0ABM0K594_APLCA|nr:signal peptidase complex subunit 1 [Aplysia californica]